MAGERLLVHGEMSADARAPGFWQTGTMILANETPASVNFCYGLQAKAASVLHANGEYARALELYSKARDGCAAAADVADEALITCSTNLGLCMVRAGKQEEALQLQQETLATCEASLGPSHPLTLAVSGTSTDAFH